MRIIKTGPFKEFEDDLDDPKTYEHLPQTIKEVEDKMFSEIGYYYCYVNYWHKDWQESQKTRVEALIKNFTDNRRDNYSNLLWYQEQLFLFQDETENMC